MSADQRPHIDKDKLKEHFDISHFDLNAIIRGIQLTLVGGMQSIISAMPAPSILEIRHLIPLAADTEPQPIEHCRTPRYLPRSTTDRQPLPLLQELPSAC